MAKSLSPLHLVLAALPGPNSEGLDLSREVALVRSSVLYADTIDLISPTGSILSTVDGLQSGKAEGMAAYIGSLTDQDLEEHAERDLSPEDLKGLRGLFSTFLLSDSEIRDIYGDHADDMSAVMAELRPVVEEGARQMRESAATPIASSGLDELRQAYEAGIVTLEPLGELSSSNSEQMMLAFVEALGAAARSSSTRLLIDDSVSTLMEEMVDKGHVKPSALMRRHSREAAVGTGLITKLPAFPHVPIDELLDLRGDLEEPLARYRKAASELGQGLTLEAFDPESSAEIDDLWRFSVAPTIEDLREELGHHSLVKEVARSATTDIKTLITGAAGPAVYIGLKDVWDLNAWAIATAAAISGGTAVHHLVKGALEHSKAQREVAQEGLFYLVALDKRL